MWMNNTSNANDLSFLKMYIKANTSRINSIYLSILNVYMFKLNMISLEFVPICECSIAPRKRLLKAAAIIDFLEEYIC